MQAAPRKEPRNAPVIPAIKCFVLSSSFLHSTSAVLFWGCRSIQHLLHAQIAAQITPLGYQTAAAHIPAQKHVLPIAAPGRQHFGQIAVLIGTGIDGFYSLDEFLLYAAGIHGLQFGHFLAVVRVHSRRDQIPHLIHRCLRGCCGLPSPELPAGFAKRCTPAILPYIPFFVIRCVGGRCSCSGQGAGP